MPRTTASFLRLAFSAGALLACALPLWAHSQIESVRFWPAEEYTRVAFEARTEFQSTLFTVENPDRLVLDLEGVDSSKALDDMAQALKSDDPYIKSIRVGHFKPGVLRVVFDLKARVKASTMLIKPVAQYGYRLMLDVYPEVPVVDPLMTLLEQKSMGASPPLAADVATAPVVTPSVMGTPAPAISVPTPPSRSGAERRITIALDAGHGGEDPGAHGRAGTHEKNVTLAIVRRLKALVDAQPNLRALLVRDGDYFIPLQERTAKARHGHADLFVSVHADAFINRDARGSSVFALSERGATSVAARWLAKHENEADLIGGVNTNVKEPYLAQTLFDLSQTATINDSLKMAHAVLGELSQVNDLHKGQVEQAGFAVLKSPDIPSILVETAFITNPDEERRLNDARYQDKLAHAILMGIQHYLATNQIGVRPPRGSDPPRGLTPKER